MLNNLISSVWVSILLVLFQTAAALPWLFALDPLYFKKQMRRSAFWLLFLGVTLALGLLLGVAVSFRPAKEPLSVWGGFYGALLHAQLIPDLFVVMFGILLLVWRRGAAVALAAFREGLRQPMFWFITVIALVGMLVSPIIPYFTFGEDQKMVKELGYDVSMLAAVIFGVLAASMSISEEIEGRTAITLMSKPISRREFLLGKYVGLLFASLMMTGILSLVFDGTLVFKLWYDKEPIPVPPGVDGFADRFAASVGEVPSYFVRGATWWYSHATTLLPGTVIGFCQVMVLLAIAVALATRLPMVVNLVICLVIFFLGHLTPVLSEVSQNRYTLIQFMAQLFDTILPGLDYFSLGPAIARDAPPDSWPFLLYVASVAFYAVLYSIIALLFGLILFEDRDLA